MAIFRRVSLAPQRLNDLNVSIAHYLKALHQITRMFDDIEDPVIWWEERYWSITFAVRHCWSGYFIGCETQWKYFIGCWLLPWKMKNFYDKTNLDNFRELILSLNKKGIDDSVVWLDICLYTPLAPQCLNDLSVSIADPPENCHLNVKKLPKTWHFFQKNWQKLAILLKKMTIFVN